MKWGSKMINEIDSLDIDENELASMICENDDHVKDLIYAKYGYIIDVIYKKYKKAIRMLQIDEEEFLCEASYGFSDGIYCFSDNNTASLKTFLTVCIERRVRKLLRKYAGDKARFLNATLSLDYVYSDTDVPLIDFLADNSDPLSRLTNKETYNETVAVAKKVLSDFEYKVFTYMINEVSYIKIAEELGKTPKQIDNTIQRIKVKMKKHIEA